ncbi:MAG: O-antigen ligase family protein [Patescibacteria group bacterium]
MTHAILILEIVGVIGFLLGQLGRISFLNQQINIYPHEICMIASLIIMVIKYNIKPLKANDLHKKIKYFMAWLTVSFILTVPLFDLYESFVGGLYFLRLALYFAHFLYFLHFISSKKIYMNYLYKLLVLIVLGLISASTLQYLFYPNLRNLLYQGWDPHLYRVFGFFFEPYLAGASLGLSLYFVLFRLQMKKTWKFLKTLLLLMIFILIVLTFSRTVYLAFLISLIFLLIREGKYVLILLSVCAFVLTVFLAPKPVGVGVQLYRTFSITTRIDNALEGTRMWLKYPIFGVGYNRIRYAKANLGLTGKYDSSHAASSYHSTFVTVLTASGIPGLLLFFLLLITLARISPASSIYMLFLCILSLGDNVLIHPFMLFYYLKLLVYESSNLLWSNAR